MGDDGLPVLHPPAGGLEALRGRLDRRRGAPVWGGVAALASAALLLWALWPRGAPPVGLNDLWVEAQLAPAQEAVRAVDPAERAARVGASIAWYRLELRRP